MMRHVLVVCTANTCRSPVVERLLNRAFAGITGREGERWVATSAGTGRYHARQDLNTVAAAIDAGLDLSTHEPRRLDRDVLDADGADLVLTMARSHLPDVVGIDPGAWPRTFTLKELARRTALSPATTGEDFLDWRRRMADRRSAAAMLRPDPVDDVADPYGLAARHHVEMVAETSAAVAQLLRWGPWRETSEPAPR